MSLEALAEPFSYEFFVRGMVAATLVGGGPWQWRTEKDAEWARAFRRLDVISPWNVGNVTAVDYNTGKIAWQKKTPLPMMGGALTTAGGLMFTGEGDGWFRAYDAKSGDVLWSFFAGAGVNAPPASYSLDGKQYIVVGAGGNTQIDFKRGNNIIAFTVD